MHLTDIMLVKRKQTKGYILSYLYRGQEQSKLICDVRISFGRLIVKGHKGALWGLRMFFDLGGDFMSVYICKNSYRHMCFVH